MSGARPETPEEPHMLAGEYVLCVLEGDEMRAAAQRAESDPNFARAIAGWERRLAPLLTGVADVAPPDRLWARIQQSTTLAPSPVAAPPAVSAWPRPVQPGRVWPWKVATGASMALAAGLAAFLLVPSPGRPPIQVAAVAPPPIRTATPTPATTQPVSGGRDVAFLAALTPPETPADARPDSTAQMASATDAARLAEPRTETQEPARPAPRPAGFLAAVWPDGTVVLTAFAPVRPPAGKALELWIRPPNSTVPRSLGVLAAADAPRVTLPSAPLAGTELSISLEPPGGSPPAPPPAASSSSAP